MQIRQSLVLAAAVMILASALAYAANSEVIAHSTTERVMGAVFGIVLAAFANVIPKNLRPLSEERCAPGRAQSYRRFAAWTFVLAGLGSAVVWLTFPMALANYVSMALIASSVLLVIAVCFVALRDASTAA